MTVSPWELLHDFAQVSRELLAQPDQEPTMQRVVDLAVKTVPGADYCGISLRRGRGKVETPAATDPIAVRCDELQYDLNEGPCLDALHADHVYVVQNLETDCRWPRWAPQAAGLGIGSILSIRLATTGHTIGGLNLYAGKTHAFDADDLDLARIYADHATIALEAVQLVTGLRTALQTRHLIGIAQGVLMQRYGLTQSRSFQLLQRYSSHQNRKLRDIAQQIADTGRAPDDVDVPPGH